MTVSTTNNRVSYAGNGVTTAFSFPNKFFADTDLVVLVVTDATGASVTKTLTTDYTVSGAGAPTGGTVTMVAAPATGTTLVIYRNPPLTQLTDLVDGDPFSVETGVEAPLDRQMLVIQRLYDLISRSLRLADSDTTSASTSLPSPVASNFLGWNATATALQNYVAADLALHPVSTFIATLLDDADAATARATLGSTTVGDAVFIAASAAAARTATGAAADSAVVHNTGNETVAGIKTFSSNPVVSGGAVQFPATQVASADPNAFDDYEEGTFTPSIGGSATYTRQNGYYTKIGRVVFISIELLINAVGTGSTFTISGLPFPSGGGGTHLFAFNVGVFGGSASSVVFLSGYLDGGGSSTINLQSLTAAGTATGNANFFANGAFITLSGHYIV